jgi:hypothetical protein
MKRVVMVMLLAAGVVFAQGQKADKITMRIGRS